MDLTEGPVISGIIRYTIPIVLSSALQLLFNAADLMVVGQFCGSLSVGAISSTGAMTNLIINLFVGLSVGAGVCVAHAIGTLPFLCRFSAVLFSLFWAFSSPGPFWSSWAPRRMCSPCLRPIC